MPTQTATAVAQGADGEAGQGRAAQGCGEADGVFDRDAAVEHRQPGRHGGRGQPLGQTQRMTQQGRCHTTPANATNTTNTTPAQSRASADSSTRPQPRVGVAQPGPDHQRRAQHRQQRRGTRIGVASPNWVQATKITANPAQPAIAAANRGNRRHWCGSKGDQAAGG